MHHVHPTFRLKLILQGLGCGKAIPGNYVEIVRAMLECRAKVAEVSRYVVYTHFLVEIKGENQRKSN